MYNCAFYAKLSLCLFTYTNQLVSTQKILSRVCRALCNFAWQRVTPQAELLSWWIFFFCSPCVRSSFFSTNCFSATLFQRDGVYFLLPFKLQAAKKSHLIFALQSLGLQVDRQNVLAICSHCIYLQFSHIMLLPIEAWPCTSWSRF